MSSDTTFVPTQKATQSLEHGKIIWETSNSNVLRLRRVLHDDGAGPEPRPIIDFAGEGIATYEIKMIYQPQNDSFPCLVSNPRFRLRVFWDDNARTYLATPIDSGEMNQSTDWLLEGVRTMNALHSYSTGYPTDYERVVSSPLEPAGSSFLNKIAEMAGTLVGAVGKVFYQS